MRGRGGEGRHGGGGVLTWASLTSSCLYLLTMSLVRFSRKLDTVWNCWSTVEEDGLFNAYSRDQHKLADLR